MRAGKISDEMWSLYMSRVLHPSDPRLVDPASPFSCNNICFVVHRHKIRVMRSFEKAKERSGQLKTALYMVQANDEAVQPEDQGKLTSEIRAELLRRVSPEQTKGLPSFLPLYRGMRLLLSSKDCVRLGIVKGCVAVLRDIVLSDEEVVPFGLVAGEPHQLQYMPVSLLLQAEEVDWTLPPTELPADLPKGMDRRGLFQVKPDCDYLRVAIGNDYISVRRTSLYVTPADTITVYAAQGGTYEAVIADMQRPPNLDSAKHWLACYVMISRARSLEGFLMLRPATRKDLSAKPPQYLLDELHRLENLEDSSLQELVDYIDSLPLQVPEAIRHVLAKDAPREEKKQIALVRNAPAAATAAASVIRMESSGVPMESTQVLAPQIESKDHILQTAPLRKRIRGKTSPQDVAAAHVPRKVFRIFEKADMQACTSVTSVDGVTSPRDTKSGEGQDSQSSGRPTHQEHPGGSPEATASAHQLPEESDRTRRHEQLEGPGGDGSDFPDPNFPASGLSSFMDVDATDAHGEQGGHVNPGGTSSAAPDAPGVAVNTGSSVAFGVALCMATAAATALGRKSTASDPVDAAAAAAAAAHKRCLDADARGIGDVEKVRRMQAASREAQDSGVFGAGRRHELREGLKRLREQSTSSRFHPGSVVRDASVAVAAATTNVAEAASSIVSTAGTDDVLAASICSRERHSDTDSGVDDSATDVPHDSLADTYSKECLHVSGAGACLASVGDRLQAEGPGATDATATVPHTCSPGEHHCGPPDVDLGCSSCSLTCHPDCCSILCAFEPCPYCTSRWLVTHENSMLCIEAQMHNTGCHACGRLECWTRAEGCHAKCTRSRHVCVSTGSDGQCDSCDRWCHATNADPRCAFFNRARGHVAWTANAQQLLDTRAGTDGSVPHMSQLPWAFTNDARTELLVDGAPYRKGYGYPGDGSRGEYNNCLIDSLRQCLDDVSCACATVRRDLQMEFGGYEGPDRRRLVTHTSYLDVESHWQAIVCSLFRHGSSGSAGAVNVAEYCVVALYGDRPGHGVVLGSLHATNRLVIVNWGDVHFDPCLPL